MSEKTKVALFVCGKQGEEKRTRVELLNLRLEAARKEYEPIEVVGSEEQGEQLIEKLYWLVHSGQVTQILCDSPDSVANAIHSTRAKGLQLCYRLFMLGAEIRFTEDSFYNYVRPGLYQIEESATSSLDLAMAVSEAIVNNLRKHEPLYNYQARVKK